MLGERSLLLSGYNAIESAKKPCDNSNSPSPAVTQAAITLTPTSTAAAAAAYLYLEKVKNERMSPRMTAAQIDSLKDAIIESSAAVAAAAAIANNNNNNNHNNNCFLKNKNTGNINDNISINNSCTNNNSLVITHQQTQIGNIEHNSISKTNVNNNNSTSDELQNHSHNPQPLGHLSTHIGTNHVKKERLSPGTNGDLHSSLSRSRSTTPSSFRETSPQQSIHSSPSETMIPIHNLSSNILNTIQQAAATTSRQNAGPPTSGINSSSVSTLPADFSAHNYSDFMRSLAAKYNNTNPNDSSNSRRSAFFEMIPNSIAITNTTTTTTTTKKPLAAHKVSFSSASCNTATSKEMSITPTLPPPPPLASSAISPCEATTLKQPQQSQQIAAAAAAAAAAASNTNVSPFMTSFLSTLPFAQGVFPPLIDMSSTQALITLARAAKDTEIQNVLRSAQIPKRLSANTSPSPRPSLSVALQQAAQFVSPALMYSAQLQHQQQLAASQQSSPAHSRPIMDPHSNVATKPVPASAGHCSISDKIEVNATPLDLSSQPPPSKRLKAESISSQSSSIDGLLAHTVQRRVSSSTVATTPSPPPYIAKSVISIVGSDTTTTNENTATTPAYTNYKTVNSTPLIVGPTTSLMTGGIRQCQAQSEEVNSWSVEDVCIFVGSIDICAEYVKHFRDQCIDGSGLPLLTEDHLVNSLGMKLGPALKLRSALAKKLGGPCPCVACVAQAQHALTLQTNSGGIATTATAAAPLTATNITNTTIPATVTTTTVVGISSKSGNLANNLQTTTTTTTTTAIATTLATTTTRTITKTTTATATTIQHCNSDKSTNNSVNSSESTTKKNNGSTNPTSNICGNNDGSISNNAKGNNNCNVNIGNFSPDHNDDCNSNATAINRHNNNSKNNNNNNNNNNHNKNNGNTSSVDSTS